MAELVLIVGKSGSGKSTAGRKLDPKKTYWINVDQTPLPFNGWKAKYSAEKKNYTKISDINSLVNVLVAIPKKLPHINSIVIDTLNRVMTDRVMKDRNIKGFDKWSNLAGGIYDILRFINSDLPEDMIVYMLCHSEEGYTDSGVQYKKVTTSGKQLDKICIESMSTVVLYTKVENKGDDGSDYYFETQSDGASTAKSPSGMFEEFLIPNDLKLVQDAIYEYNHVEEPVEA